MAKQSQLIDPAIDLSSGPGLSGYVEKCLRKSFRPQGRATRAEFWSFFLFMFLFVSAAATLGMLFDMGAGELPDGELEGTFSLGGFLLLLPAFICVTIRRLHDCGREWQALLIAVLPFIGVLILLGLCLLPSQMHDNPFGPHPKLQSPEQTLGPDPLGDVFG